MYVDKNFGNSDMRYIMTSYYYQQCYSCYHRVRICVKQCWYAKDDIKRKENVWENVEAKIKKMKNCLCIEHSGCLENESCVYYSLNAFEKNKQN